MVQRTNIEKLIEDNLPEELKLLDKKIEELQETLHSLVSRKNLLLRIGVAAGVSLKEYLRDRNERFDISGSLPNSDASSEDNDVLEQQEMDSPTTPLRGSIGGVTLKGILRSS